MAMTATYNEKPVAKWTTNDFIAYLCERHKAVYGAEYAPPGRNWQVERGLIGTLIGTKGKNAKPRKYEPEVVKAFIDECFRSHRCTSQWPTVSFTWLWKWKTDVWARVQAAEKRKVIVQKAVEEDEQIDGWL
jgi:hypothetical protein